MTRRIVLTSLSELDAVRELFEDRGAVPEERALVPVIRGGGTAEREALAEAARRAGEELDRLIAGDDERRAEAGRALGRLREAASEVERLRRTAHEMGEAAERAASLAESALERSAGLRAQRVAGTAGRLRTQAEAHAAALEREARALSGREDVARLLAEERREEQAVEMREELALAGRHLDGGRNDEARRLLSSLEGRIGGEPELGEAFERLRRRERGRRSPRGGGGAGRGAPAAPARAGAGHRPHRGGRASGPARGRGSAPLRLLAHGLRAARAARRHPLPRRLRARRRADPHGGRALGGRLGARPQALGARPHVPAAGAARSAPARLTPTDDPNERGEGPPPGRSLPLSAVARRAAPAGVPRAQSDGKEREMRMRRGGRRRGAPRADRRQGRRGRPGPAGEQREPAHQAAPAQAVPREPAGPAPRPSGPPRGG